MPELPKIEDIHLDEEFRTSVNRKLTDDERARIRKNIALDGIRDAISVWNDNGKWILVDGYNRYDIWRGEGGEPPKISLVPPRITTRLEAKEWARDFQLSRRNLNDNDQTYLLGKQFNEAKDQAKLNNSAETGGGDTVSPPPSPPAKRKRTRKSQAASSGTSQRTITRAGKFAKAVDAIAETLGKKAADDIRSGAISQKDAIAIAALPSDQQGKALARAKLGKPIQDVKAPDLKDDAGSPVPDKLRAVFAIVPLFDTVLKQYVPGIQTNMRRIAEIINEYRPTSADMVAKNLNIIFTSMRPAYVCKECSGEGCVKCKNRGWRPKLCK